jgi:hypothetical protein
LLLIGVERRLVKVEPLLLPQAPVAAKRPVAGRLGFNPAHQPVPAPSHPEMGHVAVVVCVPVRFRDGWDC